MAWSRAWWVLLLAGLVCHSILSPDLDCEGQPEARQSPDAAPQQSGGTAPATAPPSPLRMAAQLLEQGDEVGACHQLALYLASNPHHFEVRIHRAELLLRLGRQSEASTEFARSLDDAEDQQRPSVEDRLRCHSFLMQIAEAESNGYATHLHRGIGLFLLAQERVKMPASVTQLPLDGLLLRATTELQAALGERPRDARAYWYLHRVWSALGQTASAQRWLGRAASAAPFSDLSAAEQRGLQLALAHQAEKSAPR